MSLERPSVETQKYDPEPLYEGMGEFFAELIDRYSLEKPDLLQFLTDALSVLGVLAGGTAPVLSQYSNVLNLWLYHHGWPPIVNVDIRSIPVLHHVAQGEVNDATQLIVDEGIVKLHTSKVMKKIYQGWRHRCCLTSRLPILKQVIDGHIRGDYALTTPVLLAQLEGLLVEKTGHCGRVSGKTYKELLDRSLPDHVILNLDDAVYQLITEKVLSQFEHGKKPSFDLARHAILHGADLEYANKKTSLKAILLFDFVSFQLTGI